MFFLLGFTLKSGRRATTAPHFSKLVADSKKSCIFEASTKNTWLTYLAEVFGTSILGGLCAYPVAVLLMGVQSGQVAFYAYIIPFFISTAGGALLSAIVVETLKKTKALDSFGFQIKKDTN